MAQPAPGWAEPGAGLGRLSPNACPELEVTIWCENRGVSADERDDVLAGIAAEQARLTALVQSLTAGFAEIAAASEESPPDDEHDPEGQTVAFERAQISGLLDQYRRELTALAAAAIRVRSDGSGDCTDCGGSIPLERRLAVPTTTRCVGCAQRLPGGLR